MGIRAGLKRFLDKLAAAGEKEFGDKGPSCCSGAPPARKGPSGTVAKKGPVR